MRIAGGSGSLLGWPVQRLQLVCHPNQMSHHHAKGHTSGKKNMRRENVKGTATLATKLSPSQDHQVIPEGIYLKSCL